MPWRLGSEFGTRDRPLFRRDSPEPATHGNDERRFWLFVTSTTQDATWSRSGRHRDARPTSASNIGRARPSSAVSANRCGPSLRLSLGTTLTNSPDGDAGDQIDGAGEHLADHADPQQAARIVQW